VGKEKLCAVVFHFNNVDLKATSTCNCSLTET
jgi:hypothetical protein